MILLFLSFPFTLSGKFVKPQPIYLGLPENSYVFSVGDEWQNYPCDSIYIRIVSDDTSPVEATKYPSDQNVRSFQK